MQCSTAINHFVGFEQSLYDNNGYSNSYCDTLNGGVPRLEVERVTIGAKSFCVKVLPVPRTRQPICGINDPSDLMSVGCPGPDGKYAFEPTTGASKIRNLPTIIYGCPWQLICS